MRTPPGVSSADFAAAIEQFGAAVGKEWVFTSDEAVNTYRDAYSPLWGEPDEKVASAAVAPETVAQVQQIVKIANRYSIPLYTISTGRNLAYGGSAPVYSGSVVLDLKRMNKVLEVSEDQAYALVEPGVSYFDLYRYIRERKLKLWIDCPDPGWGSVIGNALDHGAGRTPLPYRDHFGSHCGMEVVLANGELVRTGMGALPTAKTWQHFQYGAGPSSDGLFAQSNMGVVTKMGFWLLPEPEASMTGQIRVPKHDDIVPFVKILASLAFQGIVNCVFSLQSPVFAGALDAEKSALLDQPGGGSAADWDAYATSKGRHFWQTELRFYGPAKVIAAQWEHVKAKVGAIAGAQFTDGETIRFPLTDEQVDEAQRSGFVRRAELERILQSAGQLGTSRRVADVALLRRGAARGSQGLHEAVPRRRHRALARLRDELPLARVHHVPEHQLDARPGADGEGALALRAGDQGRVGARLGHLSRARGVHGRGQWSSTRTTITR